MMNFQQSDALGGLIEGIKSAQAEETTRLNQGLTLEQIMAAKQRRGHDDVMNPLLQQQQRDTNAQAPEKARTTRLTNESAEQKIKKQDFTDAMDELAISGGFPGSIDTIGQKYKMAGHPLFSRASEVYKSDVSRGVDPNSPDSNFQKMMKSMAGSDMKSRDAATENEARDARAQAAHTTNLTKSRETQAAITERTYGAIVRTHEAKMAQLKEKATHVKDPSVKQLIAKIIIEHDKVANDPALPADEKAASMQRLQVMMDSAMASETNPRVAAATAGRVDNAGLGLPVIPPQQPIPLQGGQSQPVQPKVPSQSQVQKLQQNPDKAKDFDLLFGPGSAAKVLGGSNGGGGPAPVAPPQMGAGPINYQQANMRQATPQMAAQNNAQMVAQERQAMQNPGPPEAIEPQIARIQQEMAAVSREMQTNPQAKPGTPMHRELQSVLQEFTQKLIALQQQGR